MINNIHMDDETFYKLSKYIYDECGIVLPDSKKYLLEARVLKRMRRVGINNYNDYLEFLFGSENFSDEITHFINIMTTNKTDFFREAYHFDFLTKTALPALLKKYDEEKSKVLNLWSAGCSTGEEPYTLAIVLKEYFNDLPEYKYNIFASDISTDVLERAILGIYDEEKIEVFTEELKKKYLLKSKDPLKKKVRIVPEIRALINFSRLNLLDEEYNIPGTMDVVFCRNVIIYFDKETREKVLRKITEKIVPGGYLFLGHSETVLGLKLPLERAASTIYKRV